MDGDERLLSYEELARAWGITLKGAKERVRRAGWERLRTSDDPRAPVRIRIPAGVLVRPATRPDTGPREADPREAQSGAHEAPIVELTALRVLLARAEARAEAAEAMTAERVRAAEALAAEQVRSARSVAVADVEAARRVAEETIAAQAELVAELRRQVAELAKRARPWWRRLMGE